MNDRTRWERALVEDQKFAAQYMREMDEVADALRRAQHQFDQMQALLWSTETQLAKTVRYGQDNGWMDDNEAVIE